MSLILKGIDLPKVNEIRMIAITQSGVVFFTTVKDGETSKSGKAKAIQIPTPHGRLVDADDIKAKCINEVFESMGTVAITDPYPDDEWADDICDVPTILEAEE